MPAPGIVPVKSRDMGWNFQAVSFSAWCRAGGAPGRTLPVNMTGTTEGGTPTVTLTLVAVADLTLTPVSDLVLKASPPVHLPRKVERDGLAISRGEADNRRPLEALLDLTAHKARKKMAGGERGGAAAQTKKNKHADECVDYCSDKGHA